MIKYEIVSGKFEQERDIENDCSVRYFIIGLKLDNNVTLRLKLNHSIHDSVSRFEKLEYLVLVKKNTFHI